MGNIFLVTNILNFIYYIFFFWGGGGGVLEIPDIIFFFGGGGGGGTNGRCWARAYVWRKNESTPLPSRIVA